MGGFTEPEKKDKGNPRPYPSTGGGFAPSAPTSPSGGGGGTGFAPVPAPAAPPRPAQDPDDDPMSRIFPDPVSMPRTTGFSENCEKCGRQDTKTFGYCSACGGSDHPIAGRFTWPPFTGHVYTGHRFRCPAGKMGTPIGNGE